MGCVKDIATNPLTTAVTDIGLSLIPGAAPFIPLANAAESTVGGVASGESFGKAIGQGAIAGGEALAGQELAGAVGVGSGNDAFNSALGITGDNPAGTGLPDIGGGINGILGSSGGSSGGGAIDPNTGLAASAESTNAAGATINSSTGNTVAAPSTSTSVSPVSGSPVGAGQAIDFGAGQIDAQLFPDSVSSGTSTATSPGLGSVSGGSSGATANSFPGPVGGEVPISTGNAAIGAAQTDALGSVSSPLNPQPVQGPVPSGSSTGGLSDFLPSKATIGKDLFSAAPALGMLGYEAIKGPPPLPAATQPLTASGAVTAPLLATETADANAYNTGTLTAPQQASIDEWVQGQQNQLLQQIANSGVQNPTQDSRFVSGMAQIQQQALAQKQAILQQDITNAFSAAGAAGQNLGTVANSQVQNDTAYQQALAAAMAALGGTAGTAQKVA
jgi:hypothetical protein